MTKKPVSLGQKELLEKIQEARDHLATTNMAKSINDLRRKTYHYLLGAYVFILLASLGFANWVFKAGREHEQNQNCLRQYTMRIDGLPEDTSSSEVREYFNLWARDGGRRGGAHIPVVGVSLVYSFFLRASRR